MVVNVLIGQLLNNTAFKWLSWIKQQRLLPVEPIICLMIAQAGRLHCIFHCITRNNTCFMRCWHAIINPLFCKSEQKIMVENVLTVCISLDKGEWALSLYVCLHWHFRAFSRRPKHSYTDGGGCHARSRPAHQEQCWGSVSCSRPLRLADQGNLTSDSKTLALPLSHSRPGMAGIEKVPVVPVYFWF